jgi:hypothetical protein
MPTPGEADQYTGRWRVGTKLPLNVYQGDRPICQCHSVHDASMIVTAVNAMFDEARTRLSRAFFIPAVESTVDGNQTNETARSAEDAGAGADGQTGQSGGGAKE